MRKTYIKIFVFLGGGKNGLKDGINELIKDSGIQFTFGKEVSAKRLNFPYPT